MAGLNNDQIQDFLRVFNLFDKDGSAAIERNEMKNILTEFGFSHLSKSDLDGIMAKIDVDLSGQISKDEFLQFMESQIAMLEKECAFSVMDIIDYDNDGVIDFAEFAYVVRMLNTSAKDRDLQKIFKLADTDSSGKVNREEFKAALQKGGLWRELGLTIATVSCMREVMEQYSRLATDPSKGFGTLKPLPYGKDNARRLGYDVEQFPREVWESACQCANIFDLIPDKSAFAGATVVELGCGSGADLVVAASYCGRTGTVIGVDMNKQMIRKAERNVRLCGFSKTTSVHLGIFDGPELPEAVKKNAADFLMINGTLNLSPRKSCALKNAARALKKGGMLLLCDVIRKGGAPPIRPGAWCDCIAGAVTEKELRELLSAAGFCDMKMVGFSDYKTSGDTPTAMITAIRK